MSGQCSVIAVARLGLCFVVILIGVLHSEAVVSGAPQEEAQKHNQEALASDDDDDVKEQRRAEIARTNRELTMIQTAVLDGLKENGVVPPENMGLIPSGSFVMGLDETDLSGLKPAHRVYLDAYWIDRSPVTNDAYRACVEAKVCRPPTMRQGGFLNRREYHDNPEFANFPVNYVRYGHATDYCKWAGKRLPTEAEWEKAARGDDGRLYAWGDEIPEGFLETNPIQPVGSRPEGASPYGVMNMGGNMWEWVADSYNGDFYENSPVVNPTGPELHVTKVKRGGDRFILTPWAVIRSPEWTHDSNPNVGFRCAKDLTIP
ncbi:MAG TPA: hypothetical protein EYG58_02655 [Nitrospirales bacterium]|nr:hypothetical protein [Nitrospirales bacterium]HIO69430.1 hypothetical protein [Nitrospirales bacterium]